MKWEKDYFNLDMKERVVVITGGAKGIGKEMAKAYLMKGAKVIIIDISYNESSIREEMPCSSEMLDFYKLDITNEEQVNELVQSIYEKNKFITHLINNAGIYATDAIESISNKNLENTFNVNLFGALNMIKAVLPIMKKQNYGFIINMSSVAAFHNGINAGPYNMSKSAVVSMTKTLAKETRDYDIKVNAICPGLVKTPMYTEMLEKRAKHYGIALDEFEKNMMDGCEQKRLIDPREIASLALFLGSDMANGISGTAIVVSGNGLVF